MEQGQHTRLRQLRTGRSGTFTWRAGAARDAWRGLWVPDDGGVPVEVNATNQAEFTHDRPLELDVPRR